MNTKNIATAAISSILALGTLTVTSANAVPNQPSAWEKCAGIAKAGKNDCGALNGSHNCAGQATVNDDINDHKIIISAKVCSDILSIAISDNGKGMTDEVKDNIFEPFYTSSSKGTGLGLAVVKSVVEAHQGEVKYLSQPGEGAHFCVKIPLLSQVNLKQAQAVHKANKQEKSHESS